MTLCILSLYFVTGEEVGRGVAKSPGNHDRLKKKMEKASVFMVRSQNVMLNLRDATWTFKLSFHVKMCLNQLCV